MDSTRQLCSMKAFLRSVGSTMHVNDQFEMMPAFWEGGGSIQFLFASRQRGHLASPCVRYTFGFCPLPSFVQGRQTIKFCKLVESHAYRMFGHCWVKLCQSRFQDHGCTAETVVLCAHDEAWIACLQSRHEDQSSTEGGKPVAYDDVAAPCELDFSFI